MIKSIAFTYLQKQIYSGSRFASLTDNLINMNRECLKIVKPQSIFVEPESGESCVSSASRISGSIKADGNNTLGALTRKFVQLIKAAPDQTIEIHEASQKLGIQKRRIYDITNVLEGIGYIEKLGKNLMKWVGGIDNIVLQRELADLERRCSIIDSKNRSIDEEIEQLKKKLIEESNACNTYNYFEDGDIEQIMKGLEVKRLFVYEGGIGDHIQSDSNPETGCSKFIIESLKTTAAIYYVRLPDKEKLQTQSTDKEKSQIVIAENDKKKLKPHQQTEKRQSQEKQVKQSKSKSCPLLNKHHAT